ncbi:hypothetical protein GTQ40_12960 [Flavobacteriaceae bacterium R38]|nr:hypothetical protein [Flavobacteriaceae bacterium R38]
MKKILISLLFITGGQCSLCFAQTTVYQIDYQKSKVAFSIAHMGFLTVKGQFDDFSGKLAFNSNGVLQTIESKISVKSIHTGDESRDKSLRSDAYLDADKFPQIRFYSSEINPSTHIITGFLKIKEVEKKISMPFKINQKGLITISTTLKRSDFKLDFGATDVLIGKNINVELELYKK